MTGARVFCFRYKPIITQKVKAETPQKALTALVTDYHPDTDRCDWELVWEDSEERVYGEQSCES
jgi:hypothetical protein